MYCISDLENVLAKKDHDLEGCLMSVQLYDERKAEERLDPRRFILSGFSEDCKCSHLSVFIKSCSKGAEHSWEVLNDGERIAVTFKQDIDVQAFLKKCSSKRLQNLHISASRLEYTDTVLVEGNMENISEEVLRAYFSSRSKGGQVKCMNLDNKPKSVLIEFDHFHVANRVAEEKHNICGVSLCALLYYSSLQQALTGEKPTTPPSPHEFSIPVDALFLEYIQNDEVCKEDFESTLKELNTSISFKADPEIPQVVLEMAVDRESLLLHRLAHTWERKTKQAAEALLEKYSTVMLMSTEEVWDRVKDKCLSLNLKTSRVTFESTKNSVVVVGQQNKVKKLQESCEVIETEIAEFCNSHCDTPPHLREIFIVDSDAKTVEEFHTVLKEKGYKSTDSTETMLSVPPAKTTKQATAPPPRLPKPGSDCIVDIGGITVILKKGDITKEAVDAIVNSNNKSLNLDTGVSGAILKAAGKSVQDECAKLGTQNEDGVVVTGGGNLKCKHIIQMVGPTTTAGITTSTERVLQLCESKNTTAVSFPAIGTGRGNIKPEESIKAILKGLQNHLSQTTSTTIKFIFIVFAQNNSKKIEVVQIQRIQHQEQWRKYAKINKNGFNRSFCGRNATMYGCGTYFAKEAHYSCHDQYSNPDGNGHKYIYRARVLTGKPCLGLQGMKAPSPVDPNNLQTGLHDCAVDNLQNPFIFVIFCDSGAYPEYLITFKTV
ncbi:hypothetical protein COCON_G00051370 [Conger conger]|uniref:Poly [ADP-ribose] polymerase n=1 Tax=Conger conger TaxID=82655 RepID=A0A9Q1DVR0_CONCO|nr:hypothetical protein COCON_G00051370 [Conger conger]